MIYKITNDRTQTANLFDHKQPICPLSRNHCPIELISLYSDSSMCVKRVLGHETKIFSLSLL